MRWLITIIVGAALLGLLLTANSSDPEQILSATPIAPVPSASPTPDTSWFTESEILEVRLEAWMSNGQGRILEISSEGSSSVVVDPKFGNPAACAGPNATRFKQFLAKLRLHAALFHPVDAKATKHQRPYCQILLKTKKQTYEALTPTGVGDPSHLELIQLMESISSFR